MARRLRRAGRVVLVARALHPQYRADDRDLPRAASATSSVRRGAVRAPTARTDARCAARDARRRRARASCSATRTSSASSRTSPALAALGARRGRAARSARPPSRSRSRCCARRARAASTSRSPRGRASACRSSYGGPGRRPLRDAASAIVRSMPGRLVGETVDGARPARLRAHARDARAAHPPRAGDLEHLHEPGALRARGHGLPLAARPARARARSPSANYRGAHARRRAPRARSGRAALRGAVLQRVRRARARRRRRAGSALARERRRRRACRSGAGTRSSRTRCSSA